MSRLEKFYRLCCFFFLALKASIRNPDNIGFLIVLLFGNNKKK